MTDILEKWTKRFNITKEEAEKRRLVPTDSGTRTATKELIGEAIIKKYNVFDWIFPGNTGYRKVSNKKEQLAGVDYEIYEGEDIYYVDLKCCIGQDYNMKPDDFDEVEVSEDLLSRKGVPVEIYQNGYFTNTAGKLTDFMLYIICDFEGIKVCSLPYNEIRNFSLKHKTEYIIDKESGTAHEKAHYPFTRYKSFNGTGIYAKKPVFANKIDW